MVIVGVRYGIVYTALGAKGKQVSGSIKAACVRRAFWASRDSIMKPVLRKREDHKHYQGPFPHTYLSKMKMCAHTNAVHKCSL